MAHHRNAHYRSSYARRIGWEIDQCDGLLNEKTRKPCEASVGNVGLALRACIPGSAIKGILCSWAETFLSDPGAIVNKIFGDSDIKSETAESGLGEFLTAFIDDDFALPSMEHVPYWG